MHALLVALVLLCFMCFSSGSLWSYSIKPLKPTTGTTRASFRDQKVLPSRDGKVIHAHLGSKLSVRRMPPGSLEKLTMRTVIRSFSSRAGKLKYEQRDSVAVVALPLSVFGYRNMMLNMDVDGRCSPFCCKWKSSSKPGLEVSCEVMQSADDTVSIETKASGRGVTKADLNVITKLIHSAYSAELERELRRMQARGEQEQCRQEQYQASAVATKKKELDKILHPEKYRNKSPTVRKTGTSSTGTSGAGSAGASGRYTPSASTQARRQVKRG